MVRFSIRPSAESDIVPHVSLFSVGDNAEWVGHGSNMLYRPFSEQVLDPNNDDMVVLARAAFSVERPIIGQHRYVPEGKLGQVALLASLSVEDGFYKTAVAVPYKERLLMVTKTAIVQSKVHNIRSADEIIKSPTVQLHGAVRQAIFELINSEELA